MKISKNLIYYYFIFYCKRITIYIEYFLKGVLKMAKKLGKALLFTAVAGAIAAGGVALYNKYKASTDDFDDDFLDFDDEDDDFDDDDDFVANDEGAGREYVSIPRESDDVNAKDTSVKDESENPKVNVDVTIDTSGFSMEDEESDEEDKDEKDTSASAKTTEEK